MKINKLHKLKLEKSSPILNFGEYRKGSNEYGQFIQDIMIFLRNFKKNDDDKLIFKIKDITFDINKLLKLKNDPNKTRLISFNINFFDNNKNNINFIDKNGTVEFTDLNKKNDRPWENKQYV